MNITLKNVPADVHAQLKQMAEKEGRSMNRTAIMILRRGLAVPAEDKTELLARIRARREKMTKEVTHDQIQAYKNFGRP